MNKAVLKVSPKGAKASAFQRKVDEPRIIMGRFIDNEDGTLTDLKTRLMWIRDMRSAGCNYGKTMKWEEAVKCAKSLSVGDYSDWRLPEIDELVSIVDYGKLGPAIHDVFSNTPCGYFWSNTIFKSDSRAAWVVGFDTGRVNGDDRNEFFYLRCVRSVK